MEKTQHKTQIHKSSTECLKNVFNEIELKFIRICHRIAHFSFNFSLFNHYILRKTRFRYKFATKNGFILIFSILNKLIQFLSFQRIFSFSGLIGFHNDIFFRSIIILSYDCSQSESKIGPIRLSILPLLIIFCLIEFFSFHYFHSKFTMPHTPYQFNKTFLKSII